MHDLLTQINSKSNSCEVLEDLLNSKLFFSGYRERFHKVENIKKYFLDTKKSTLNLIFKNYQNKDMTIKYIFHSLSLIQFKFIVDENKEEFKQQTSNLSFYNEEFTNDKLQFIVSDGKEKIRINIDLIQMNLKIFKEIDNEFCIVSIDNAIYYKIDELLGLQIIQEKAIFEDNKFIGFNPIDIESFSIDNCQFTYKNFKNTKNYDNRIQEKLFLKDSFIFEIDQKLNIFKGMLINSKSEVYVDFGVENKDTYLVGTLLDGVDSYFLISSDIRKMIENLVGYVGKSSLKPRFVLGFHQGSDSYQNFYDKLNEKNVINIVDKYRSSGIPIDGIHFDINIQKDYCTFTMDENKFPEELVSTLKKKGIKCSTNINPIINNSATYNYKSFKSAKLNNFFIKTRNNNSFSGEIVFGKINVVNGNYPDMSKEEVRIWWGQQYKLLIQRGIEMICHNISNHSQNTNKYRLNDWYLYNIQKSSFNGLNNLWFITQYSFIDIEDVTLRESQEILIELISKDVLIKFDDNNDKIRRYIPSENWKEKILKCKLEKKEEVIKIIEQSLAIKKIRNNKRNTVISDESTINGHKYSILGSSYSKSTWESLRLNLVQMIVIGFTGNSIIGSDIGGFEKDPSSKLKWVEPELLMRWTIVGAFFGLFRNNYNGLNEDKHFQEFFRYSEKDVLSRINPNEHYLYKAVLPVCKRYIRVRYSLLQFLYDYMFLNTINGMPIIRAMFMVFNDKSLYNENIKFLNNQFILGNEILVSPILSSQKENNGIREIYLPKISDDHYENMWYNYQYNKYPLQLPVKGGEKFEFDASFKEEWIDINIENDKRLDFLIGLYIKAGAIIPTIEVENYVGELYENPITLNIYPGPKGNYTLFQDDGVSRSSEAIDSDDKYANEEYRLTKINHYYIDKNLRAINIKFIHNNFVPKENYMYIALLHDDITPIESIFINNMFVEYIGDGGSNLANELSYINKDAWYYNNDINISFLKVFLPLDLKLTFIKDEDMIELDVLIKYASNDNN